VLIRDVPVHLGLQEWRVGEEVASSEEVAARCNTLESKFLHTYKWRRG
jgi:hypothetical protein